MAGPDPRAGLYKLTYSGTIGADEIFAYSRWVTGDNINTPEVYIDDFLGDVADMLATAVSGGGVPTLESAFPDTVVWDQLKLAPWDIAGNHLITGASPAYRTISENGNGGAGSGLPNQVALAMTTRSVLAGRRKYNRFYLPPLTIQATDGGGVLGAQEADAFVLWLHLNITARDTTGEAFVNYNPGAATPVNRIIDIYLGRRMDIIRRRANHQPEIRVVDTL